MSKFLLMFAGLLVVCRLMGADEPLVLSVWPGDVPGDYGTIGPERVRAPSEAPTKNAKWITGVTKPTITVFRPAKDKNTGAAMVICPGGGYWNLAWDKEGEEVAAWLNSVGITGVVLKYRVPRRSGEPGRGPRPGAVARCAAGDQPRAEPGVRMGDRPGTDRHDRVLGGRTSRADDGDLVRS